MQIPNNIKTDNIIASSPLLYIKQSFTQHKLYKIKQSDSSEAKKQTSRSCIHTQEEDINDNIFSNDKLKQINNLSPIKPSSHYIITKRKNSQNLKSTPLNIPKKYKNLTKDKLVDIFDAKEYKGFLPENIINQNKKNSFNSISTIAIVENVKKFSRFNAAMSRSPSIKSLKYEHYKRNPETELISKQSSNFITGFEEEFLIEKERMRKNSSPGMSKSSNVIPRFNFHKSPSIINNRIDLETKSVRLSSHDLQRNMSESKDKFFRLKQDINQGKLLVNNIVGKLKRVQIESEDNLKAYITKLKVDKIKRDKWGLV